MVVALWWLVGSNLQVNLCRLIFGRVLVAAMVTLLAQEWEAVAELRRLAQKLQLATWTFCVTLLAT